MPKFSGSGTKTRPPAGPTMTTGSAPTHEGGAGWEKDAKTALYTLGVTNMVSEPTFYEAAATRDDRFRNLVAQVTAEDPEWMQGFIPWLRSTANMRSAPLVAALEYARAGGPSPRGVIASALQRADEPAEALGYWLQRYGRRIPMGVKRGIADGAKKLYNEYSALKYDGQSHGVRMGDVIELTHPRPDSPKQGTFFKHLLDRRHGHWQVDDQTQGYLRDWELTKLAAAYELDAVPMEQRRQRLREASPFALADAGYTWERLSGWVPDGMDAEAWEAVIPAMGYMALLRNLRNFEEKKVSENVLAQVAAKLADPAEVAKSKQFPYRFLSAYINSGTTYFAPALEKALNLSLQNVPIFPGRTLVLVDTSSSMMAPVSQRSAVKACDVGALFGVAVEASSTVDFVIYATDHAKVTHLAPSVLRATEFVQRKIGSVGHGTNTWPAVLAHYKNQDRIVVFTDGQDHPSRAHERLPDVPIYVWDLNGYSRTNVNLIEPGRYCFGGFNDNAFKLISLLEAGQDAGWPWEA